VPGADLERWTPAGRSTADYAVDLLLSLEPDEITAAEGWLLAHPAEAVPVLLAALDSPAAQPAAVLLGLIGDPAAIAPLVAAHRRGGAGLRAAVERGLAASAAPEAAAALASLTRPGS
jgi:hypothetical protein